MPKSVGSGRSFSSLSAPQCWKSTWTWSLVTSTELLGANQMVTTLDPPVLSRKLLPTQIFQCHLAPLKPPDSCDKWKVRLHGAFTIPRETLGLRPKDQSGHHEVWLHLDLVGNQHAHESRGKQERSCPYPPNKEKGRYDDEGDRSLSSLSSAREPMLPYSSAYDASRISFRERIRPKQA